MPFDRQPGEERQLRGCNAVREPALATAASGESSRRHIPVSDTAHCEDDTLRQFVHMEIRPRVAPKEYCVCLSGRVQVRRSPAPGCSDSRSRAPSAYKKASSSAEK
jgi:hypothetical protein